MLEKKLNPHTLYPKLAKYKYTTTQISRFYFSIFQSVKVSEKCLKCLKCTLTVVYCCT